MSQLTKVESARGVIAASAGNHAQGVALSAKAAGISAKIVMPTTTPQIKVRSVREHGGDRVEVILHGDTYDEAYAYAKALQEEHNHTFVHPFDDIEVIAGQGTVGCEILYQLQREHHRSADVIFVPVGGGGLISGVAAYVKYVRPDIKIIGVEHDAAASLYASLKQGRRVTLDQVGIFADGTAVACVGKHPWDLIQQHRLVDEVITVSTDEICAAISDIFEDTRSLVEPSGALAVAGLKKFRQRQLTAGEGSSPTLVAIQSGANINFHRLRHISERTELAEAKETIFCARISEQPGSFSDFCNALDEANVTEFNYRYAGNRKDGPSPPANIFVGVSSEGGLFAKEELLGRLQSQSLDVLDLSGNELAQLHLRHMVGGPAEVQNSERVFRVRFPERPGALRKFLDHLGSRWNLTMFHYRNHGAELGRVLAGFDVPESENREFDRFLDKLGYAFSEETDNPAYQRFLTFK